MTPGLARSLGGRLAAERFVPPDLRGATGANMRNDESILTRTGERVLVGEAGWSRVFFRQGRSSPESFRGFRKNQKRTTEIDSTCEKEHYEKTNLSPRRAGPGSGEGAGALGWPGKADGAGT